MIAALVDFALLTVGLGFSGALMVGGIFAINIFCGSPLD